jgi:hypothetical protein
MLCEVLIINFKSFYTFSQEKWSTYEEFQIPFMHFLNKIPGYLYLICTVNLPDERHKSGITKNSGIITIPGNFLNSERQMFDKERQWLSIVKHPSWLSLTLQWPFIISRQRIKFYKLLGSWLSCVKGLNFFVGNCFWTCYCRDVEMSTILILIILNFNICLIFCDGKYIVLRSQIFNSTFKLILI